MPNLSTYPLAQFPAVAERTVLPSKRTSYPMYAHEGHKLSWITCTTLVTEVNTKQAITHKKVTASFIANQFQAHFTTL